MARHVLLAPTVHSSTLPIITRRPQHIFWSASDSCPLQCRADLRARRSAGVVLRRGCPSCRASQSQRPQWCQPQHTDLCHACADSQPDACALTWYMVVLPVFCMHCEFTDISGPWGNHFFPNFCAGNSSAARSALFNTFTNSF